MKISNCAFHHWQNAIRYKNSHGEIMKMMSCHFGWLYVVEKRLSSIMFVVHFIICLWRTQCFSKGFNFPPWFFSLHPLLSFFSFHLFFSHYTPDEFNASFKKILVLLHYEQGTNHHQICLGKMMEFHVRVSPNK